MHTDTLKGIGDNEILQYQREEQLIQRKEQYRWQQFPETGIPSGIDSSALSLPPDEQFGVVKYIDFGGGALAALEHLGISNIEDSIHLKKIDELQEFEELATVLGTSDKPLYQAGRWATDVEFGRQMLNGVNPIVITKCTQLPPNFPVTEEMVKPLLNRGLSLKEEMNVSM